MKVTHLKSQLVDLPLEQPIATAIHHIVSIGCLLVELETDQGLIGESYVIALNGGKLKSYDEMLKSFAPLIEGIRKVTKEVHGLDIDAKQVIVNAGAKHSLFNVFMALLDPGDEVIIPAPYWVSYTTQVEAAGAHPVSIPMNDDTGRIDIDGLAQAINEKTSLLILNSPNNPGGYVFTTEEMQQIGALVQGKPIWVICDEMYEYLTYEGEHISMLSVCPALKEQFILVNGMSKGFAMTGWRVGYCAAPAPVAKLVKTLQSQSSTCLPAFIEQASVFALENRKKFTTSLCQAMDAKRQLVNELLSDSTLCRPLPAEGAFYCFIDVRDTVRNAAQLPEKSSMAFGSYLLENHQVAMVPGEAFGAPGFMRLSYAASVDDLKQGLERFKQALKEISGNS